MFSYYIMKISKRMRHAKRGKHTKRAKYTRHTKHRGKQYKNKRTYRKHPRKLKHKSRLQKGGDPYIFEYDSDLGVYSSTGLLTYKRKDAWTNKTKSFDMRLTYDQTITDQEEEYPQRSYPNTSNFMRELELLTREVSPKGAVRLSINPPIKLFGVFKLEMTSQDDKNQKFVVYFRVDTAIADFPNHVSEGNILKIYPVYLKAVVRYSLDGTFNRLPILLETEFMKVDDTPALGEICGLFNMSGLQLKEKIGETETPDGICYFPCSDNKTFFWNLVYTMVKNATEAEAKAKLQSPPTASE